MNWNKRIKEARLAAGMSNAELARAVGVSSAAVTLWENGTTKNLDAANCIRVCAALGIRPEWLMFGSGAMRGTNTKVKQSVVALLASLSDEDLRRAEAVLQAMFQVDPLSGGRPAIIDPQAIERKYSPGAEATPGVQVGKRHKTNSA